MADRIKRLIAVILDWNFSLLPGFLIALIGSRAMEQGKNGLVFLIVGFVLAFGGVALFVLRDAAFGGRSIGKRMLGLHVLDAETRLPVKGQRAALKNLPNVVSVLLPVDALLLLLANGGTLGERLSKTVVLSGRTMERMQRGEEIVPPTFRQRAITVAVLAGVYVILFLLSGALMMGKGMFS